MTELWEEDLLERLDAFFSDGENTDAIGNFLSEEHDFIRQLDTLSDSSEALELYSFFKRYTAVVDSLLCTFTDREVKAGSDVSLEKLAAVVMREWQKQEDGQNPCRYLCTSYIAGALDFDSFKLLMADVNAITTYPVGSEITEDDGAGEETSSDESEEGS